MDTSTIGFAFGVLAFSLLQAVIVLISLFLSFAHHRLLSILVSLLIFFTSASLYTFIVVRPATICNLLIYTVLPSAALLGALLLLRFTMPFPNVYSPREFAFQISLKQILWMLFLSSLVLGTESWVQRLIERDSTDMMYEPDEFVLPLCFYVLHNCALRAFFWLLMGTSCLLIVYGTSRFYARLVSTVVAYATVTGFVLLVNESRQVARIAIICASTMILVILPLLVVRSRGWLVTTSKE